METENRTSQKEGFSTQLSNKKTAKQLSEMAGAFNFYFFSPRDSEQPILPQLMVRIAPMRKERLITHQRTQNSLDLPYEVVINERWIRRPQWEIAEILAHQLIHIYQEIIQNKSASEDCYHNREFLEISENLGFSIRQKGGYHEKPASGQFAELMARLGIEKPEYTIDDLTIQSGNRIKHWWDYDRGLPEGRSTLYKYICGCRPENSVRSGKRDQEIDCRKCGQPFKAVDSLKPPKRPISFYTDTEKFNVLPGR